MARKSNNSVIEQDDPIAAEAVGTLMETANSMAEHSQQIMEVYGEGLPYDRVRVAQEARFYMSQSAEAMLETGKRLIILKEHEAHGDWVTTLRELSIEPRLAQRFMQAAVRFSKASTSTLLVKAAQSKSKLFELMALDDEDLDELSEGGTVAGITLDDIEKMPVSQLRAALRKSREDNEDQQRVLEAKNKKIDDQAKRISRISKQPVDETSTQMRTEITQLVSTIDHEMRVNLFSGLNDLKMHGEDNEITQADFLRAQVTQLEGTLSFLRENLCNGVEWE